MALFSADVNGDLEAWARQAASAVVEAVRTEVGAVVNPTFNEAKNLWPVRPEWMYANHPRGYSRSKLSQDVRQTTDAVEGVIRNGADYAYAITSRRTEQPSGSQFTAAWGPKMMKLLDRQEMLVQSGRMFKAGTSHGGGLSKAWKNNQRAIKRHAVRQREAKHVWSLLVREPVDRKSAGMFDRLGTIVVDAIGKVR